MAYVRLPQSVLPPDVFFSPLYSYFGGAYLPNVVLVSLLVYKQHISDAFPPVSSLGIVLCTFGSRPTPATGAHGIPDVATVTRFHDQFLQSQPFIFHLWWSSLASCPDGVLHVWTSAFTDADTNKNHVMQHTLWGGGGVWGGITLGIIGVRLQGCD